MDAIKNLNTEILAGNGPDIIYMTGLNIDKYLQETIKYLETVNEPINVDYIFDDIMIGQLNDFVYGDVTLDSAVDSTIEKIQLYLSE